jgi:hypothetical protein
MWRNSMDLGLRRLVLVVLSILGGIGLVYVMFFVINAALHVLLRLPITTEITAERFDTIYFVLSAFTLALLVGVWLDYFLHTGILPIDQPGATTAPAPKKGRAAREAAPAAEADE